MDAASSSETSVTICIYWRLDASPTSSTKIKVSFSLSTPWRQVGGSRGIALLSLNLAIRWGRMVNFTTRPFYTWKRISVALDRRLVGLTAGLGVLENRKTSCLYWDSNPGPSKRSLVAVMSTPTPAPVIRCEVKIGAKLSLCISWTYTWERKLHSFLKVTQ